MESIKTISTLRLLLRSVRDDDAADIFEYCQNPNVGPAAGWKPHADLEETRQIMKTVFLGKENVFAMVLKKTGKLIGTIGLAPDPKRENEGARMLGYAIGEDYWGNGYTTEASRALIRYGFEELHLEVISVYCYPFNGRSRRVIEKCGFRYEGRLRCSEKRYDGAVLDSECYSLVREDVK